MTEFFNDIFKITLIQITFFEFFFLKKQNIFFIIINLKQNNHDFKDFSIETKDFIPIYPHLFCLKSKFICKIKLNYVDLKKKNE